MTTASTTRLEVPINLGLQTMLERAADIQGRTLTDFVVSAVQDAAQRIIDQDQTIHLSPAGQQRLAEALLSPLDPMPVLRRATARHDKLLRTE